MRGSTKHPHFKLHLLVLLWVAFELKIYVGGMSLPLDPLRWIPTAFKDMFAGGSSKELLMTPSPQALEDTRNWISGVGPAQQAHIQVHDVQIINLIQKIQPKDNELPKIYQELVQSSQDLNSKMDAVWKELNLNLNVEDEKSRGLSYLEKKKIVFEKVKEFSNLKSGAYQLEQAEDLYAKKFQVWLGSSKIFDTFPATHPENIVAVVSASSEELRNLYLKVQNSKFEVVEEVNKARKLLKDEIERNGKIIDDLDKETKAQLKPKEVSVITEISDLDLQIQALRKIMKNSLVAENQKTIDHALQNLENASTTYEKNWQESLKKTQISLEKTLGLTDESGDIPTWSLNPARLTAPEKSDKEIEGSVPALKNFNTAYTELEKQVNMAYKSANDPLFKDSELKKKMNFVEYLFDLKSRANPTSFPQNAKEGWTRKVMIQVAGNMKGEELKGAVGVSSDWERITTSYASAAHEAKVALQRDSLIAFVRSSLTPTDRGLLEDAPFFHSKTPLENLDGKSLLTKMHYTYEQAFEETLKEAKANNINVEKILKDKISRIEAESQRLRYFLPKKDLKMAAKREFMMDQAYRAQNENPIALQEFEKVRYLEEVVGKFQTEKLSLAKKFHEHKWNTIKPMSAKDAQLLNNAVLSGWKGLVVKVCKAVLSWGERNLNFLIDEVYQQAVKVAIKNGATEKQLDAELTSELEKLEKKFTGDTLTVFDKEVALRELRLTTAQKIAKKYDDESLGKKLDKLHKAQHSITELRTVTIEWAKVLQPKPVKKKKGFWSRFWSSILKFFGIKRKNKIVPVTTSETGPSKAKTGVPQNQELEKQAPQKSEDKPKPSSETERSKAITDVPQTQELEKQASQNSEDKPKSRS